MRNREFSILKLQQFNLFLIIVWAGLSSSFLYRQGCRNLKDIFKSGIPKNLKLKVFNQNVVGYWEHRKEWGGIPKNWFLICIAARIARLKYGRATERIWEWRQRKAGQHQQRFVRMILKKSRQTALQQLKIQDAGNPGGSLMFNNGSNWRDR